jgi:hypothetical protein
MESSSKEPTTNFGILYAWLHATHGPLRAVGSAGGHAYATGFSQCMNCVEIPTVYATFLRSGNLTAYDSQSTITAIYFNGHKQIDAYKDL